MDNDGDTRLARATAMLMARAETNGVASVAVDDGHVYVFMRSKLEEMLRACQESGQEKVLVFVRRGPSVDDVPEN